jgi:hypothetical protein
MFKFLLTRAELKALNERKKRKANKAYMEQQAKIARQQAYISQR